MPDRLIPCTDCASMKKRLEAAQFVVDGCVPEGDDGMCRITFHEKDDATVAAAPLAVTAVPMAAGAAAPSAPAASIAADASAVVPWDGTVPAAATAVVKRIEGFFAAPYDDNGSLPGGTWTIGYGTIVDAQGRPITPASPPITEVAAEKLLLRDMKGAANDVKLRVKVPLLTCEAAALISWTYNLGGGNLGKSTMLMRINANAKSDVPSEMRKWINHEGRPLVGLLRRRWAESAIFIGLDPTNACVRAWKDIDSLEDWPDF